MSNRSSQTVVASGWLVLTSWAVYDLANTIFSMNIITRYFPLWIKNELGGEDYYVSLTLLCAQALILVVAPPLGHWADSKARRRMLMNIFTLLCIATTVILGAFSDFRLALFIFFISVSGYFLAMVFYDSLLPSIAAPRQRGWISGVGVGLGYAGAIVGLYVVQYLTDRAESSKDSVAFVATGAMFLLFALPCMLLVRESGPSKKVGTVKRGWLFGHWRDAWHTLQGNKSALIFFIANFLLMNAVATVYTQMAFFLDEIGQFQGAELTQFLIYGTIIALVAAFPIGWLTDRIHPKIMFIGVILTWLAALALIIFANGRTLIWIAAPFVGAGLAGAWTVSRPLLLTLIPASESATFFGFNGMTGRFATILGLAIWSAVLYGFQDLGAMRYRIGCSALFGMALASLVVALWIPRLDVNKEQAP